MRFKKLYGFVKKKVQHKTKINKQGKIECNKAERLVMTRKTARMRKCKKTIM